MDPALKAHVDASLALHGYTLGDDAYRAVLENFARSAAIAAAFLDMPLAPEQEIAPVFTPE